LAAGSKGVAGFFQHLLHTFEDIWEDLADWKHLDNEQQTELIQGIERSYKGQLEHIRAARDRRLAAILKGLEEVRERQGK
jgi:hypothetical protein